MCVKRLGAGGALALPSVEGEGGAALAKRVEAETGERVERLSWGCAPLRLGAAPHRVPPGGTAQLYRLDLTVRWGGEAHPQVAHFDTLRLGKPLVPPGGAP
ncbi:MAG: hypothetical protein AAFS07_19485 [Pseudomonadota bacterium]